jgi:hypothetical protein
MMRAAGKILDRDAPQLISPTEEKAPRYVDERCKTIDPNFRRAPFNRVRSPREAQKRRAKDFRRRERAPLSYKTKSPYTQAGPSSRIGERRHLFDR